MVQPSKLLTLQSPAEATASNSRAKPCHSKHSQLKLHSKQHGYTAQVAKVGTEKPNQNHDRTQLKVRPGDDEREKNTA